MTATPARIRLVSRQNEFVTVNDATVLAANPDAQDGFERPIRSFFNLAADAAVLLGERFTFQKSTRGHEGIESGERISIGTQAAQIQITPSLPKARVIDEDRGFDRVMLIRGTAIDFNTERNSVENDG